MRNSRVVSDERCEPSRSASTLSQVWLLLLLSLPVLRDSARFNVNDFDCAVNTNFVEIHGGRDDSEGDKEEQQHGEKPSVKIIKSGKVALAR